MINTVYMEGALVGRNLQPALRSLSWKGNSPIQNYDQSENLFEMSHFPTVHQVVEELGEQLSQEMTNAVRMMSELEVVLILIILMLLMFNSVLNIADIEIVMWWRKC